MSFQFVFKTWKAGLRLYVQEHKVQQCSTNSHATHTPALSPLQELQVWLLALSMSWKWSLPLHPAA